MQHHEEAEDEVWIYNGQDEVPPTVRRVKIAENVSKIPDDAFQMHQQLEEVILSSSVQVIGNGAFRHCEKLNFILYQGLEKEEVGFPSTVKVIDDWAFSECNTLERLGLHEGLERIGQGAFYQCESLAEADFPSTVKVIDDHAFTDCILLKRLGLNEGLGRIGEYAFFGCESLTEVGFPSTVKVIDHYGLERIGEGAFGRCESLTEVDIPSTVKVIDGEAFENCFSLERLVLNEGLERIEESAFSGCESLTGVIIPSTVKVIDGFAFYGCKLLARLCLNEGLEQIGMLGFSKCDSLLHVRISQSVNSIAANAFSNCTSLISIELPEECPFNIDLSGCRSLASVAGPVPTYFREVDDWEEFLQRSKLGSLVDVDNEADLIRKLNHRFDKSPLNKLCYYQSYQFLDDAMAELRSLKESGPPLAATTEVDEFGMTPLHVLSLSQTPNLDMLLAVMDEGKPGHMVRIMDSFGCTPMDYLFLNSKEVIRRVLEIRFEQVLGLEPFWKSDMLQAIDEALAVEWSSRKSEVGRVLRKFELKEILSLLELCLWKVKIDEVATSEQMLLADRQKCRIMSCADVLIPQVLPFLDKKQDYFVASLCCFS